MTASAPSASPPSPAGSAQLAARAEVDRVRQARAAQLSGILQAGLCDEERAELARYSSELPGVLGQAWAAFINLPQAQQFDALAQAQFGSMPWQSLLQCNPYARLARWQPVELRAYP